MFETKDYVRYGSKGIFQIEDIVRKKDRSGKLKDWYVLHNNQSDVETSVLTLADNDTIRKIMTEKEVKKLIEQIPEIPSAWIEDKSKRFLQFQDMLNSGSMYQLIQLLKTVYEAKEIKDLAGKQISERDKDFYKSAELLLSEEISVCLHMKKEDVPEYIRKCISSNSK